MTTIYDIHKLQETIFILNQCNEMLLNATQRLVNLEAKDGGRSFPSIEDIQIARDAIEFYNEMKGRQKND